MLNRAKVSRDGMAGVGGIFSKEVGNVGFRGHVELGMTDSGGGGGEADMRRKG